MRSSVGNIIYVFIIVSLCCLMAGCKPKDTGADSGITGEDLITVGFSQLGAESDWRSANTESMKSVFTSTSQLLEAAKAFVWLYWLLMVNIRSFPCIISIMV